MNLRAELEQHLARWQDDLAPAWQPHLADVELDWDAVTPAALLEPNEAHYGLVQYTPGTSGRPGVMGPDKAAYGGFKAFISDLPK